MSVVLGVFATQSEANRKARDYAASISTRYMAVMFGLERRGESWVLTYKGAI